MKKILLVVLLFSCGLSAQTFTVNGTTYNIVSGDLLTVANAYAKGYDVGHAAAQGISCAPTSVSIDLRIDSTPETNRIHLGTYVSSRTTNINPSSITWTLTRHNGQVIDITDQVGDNGDINFDHRPRRNGNFIVDPAPGAVQGGDMIRVVYVDDCGTYVDTYVVPSADGAIRVPPRDRSRPPKIVKPVI